MNRLAQASTGASGSFTWRDSCFATLPLRTDDSSGNRLLEPRLARRRLQDTLARSIHADTRSEYHRGTERSWLRSDGAHRSPIPSANLSARILQGIEHMRLGRAEWPASVSRRRTIEMSTVSTWRGARASLILEFRCQPPNALRTSAGYQTDRSCGQHTPSESTGGTVLRTVATDG